MKRIIQSSNRIKTINRSVFRNNKKYFANCIVDNPYTLEV